MEFKTLFSILKKHLADGDDVPYFFRELMAMITTVTEDEWGTGKDPSVKLSDETIRSYTKRGLPKNWRALLCTGLPLRYWLRGSMSAAKHQGSSLPKI